MNLDNNKKHIYGARFAAKSGQSYLLFIILLFYGATNLSAQETSKKSGWEVNANRASEPTAEIGIAEEPKEKSDLTPITEVQEDAPESSKLTQDQVPLVPGDLTPVEVEEQVVVDSPAGTSEQGEDDIALFAYGINKSAAPIDIPNANVKLVSTLSPELRDSLEAQFQEIQTRKETEDSFSELLGESYLAYGKTLMRAGRTDEARKMLVNALHLAKISNGVNSIEQRPILRELFEMNYALGNTEQSGDHLGRIIFLEKNYSDNKDIYSFDMIVRMGNYYLDLYLNNPLVSEISVDHLNKSTRYLSYAVNRYGDRPLSEILLPYGELALAHHYKSTLRHQLDSSLRQRLDSSSYQDTRQRKFTNPSSLPARRGGTDRSFSRSQGYLKDYLRKAKDERDLVNTVRALLALGDISLLTEKLNDATKYYDLAWTGAQTLPMTHPIVESFNQPVELPAFYFSVVRRPFVSARETELIPMSINIDDDGRVRKVARQSLVVSTTVATTNRARRRVKRVRFRPIIENGKLIPISDYRYEVKLRVRKQKKEGSVKNPA